jgi:hypothetical protein
VLGVDERLVALHAGLAASGALRELALEALHEPGEVRHQAAAQVARDVHPVDGAAAVRPLRPAVGARLEAGQSRRQLARLEASLHQRPRAHHHSAGARRARDSVAPLAKHERREVGNVIAAARAAGGAGARGEALHVDDGGGKAHAGAAAQRERPHVARQRDGGGGGVVEVFPARHGGPPAGAAVEQLAVTAVHGGLQVADCRTAAGAHRLVVAAAAVAGGGGGGGGGGGSGGVALRVGVRVIIRGGAGTEA